MDGAKVGVSEMHSVDPQTNAHRRQEQTKIMQNLGRGFGRRGGRESRAIIFTHH